MIIVDAVDAHGRRYLEVQPIPALAVAFDASPDACVDCAAPIRHGRDRYFQRNDATDGAGPGIESALMALTYDPVCGRCGDQALRGAAR